MDIINAPRQERVIVISFISAFCPSVLLSVHLFALCNLKTIPSIGLKFGGLIPPNMLKFE